MNWVKEMVVKNNYFFATLPIKDGLTVFPMHKGGLKVNDSDLWECFKNMVKTFSPDERQKNQTIILERKEQP